MIKAISRDIHVQSMIQADRYIVFSIYQFVLASKYQLDLIKSVNFDTDLVYGFIQSMDREKGSFIILFKIDEFKMKAASAYARSKIGRQK